MTPTDVCITIDTEFTINGALEFPQGREPIGLPSLQRLVGGCSHGLGFILDTLERYGLRGTFFIEVMNTWYLGDGPMGQAVGEIQARGHDLQLHVHPCWQSLSGRKDGTIPADGYTDSVCDMGRDALVALLGEAREAFERLTGHPPLAFRSGSLVAHRDLFAALAQTGFRLSSTLCLGVFEPAEPELRVEGGRCRFDGVTEVPVLTYRSVKLPGRSSYKAATVIGSSFSELKTLIDQAYRLEAGPVVILTHAAEFSRAADTSVSPVYVPAPLIQRRFERLCRFLRDHADRYRTLTFSERFADWTSEPLPARAQPTLHCGLLGLGERLIENNLLPRLGVA